jgi:hypothetical protein
VSQRTVAAHEFREPEELLACTEQAMDQIGSVNLFNDPAHQKLREQWCAAMFGMGYSKHVAPCKVAVNGSRYRVDADVLVQVGARNWEFQVAEVQPPGRRRGHEYKQLLGGTGRFARLIGEPTPDDAPQWLSEGAERKKAKRYSGSRKLNLLLYANFPASTLAYGSVAAALLPYAEDFGSIWVLTSLHLCSVCSRQPDLGEIKMWAQIQPLDVHYPPNRNG